MLATRIEDPIMARKTKAEINKEMLRQHRIVQAFRNSLDKLPQKARTDAWIGLNAVMERIDTASDSLDTIRPDKMIPGFEGRAYREFSALLTAAEMALEAVREFTYDLDQEADESMMG